MLEGFRPPQGFKLTDTIKRAGADSLRNQALAQACAVCSLFSGSVSEIEIRRQLRRVAKSFIVTTAALWCAMPVIYGLSLSEGQLL
jgi:hypothetical protein